jgi:glutamyl-tRNA synthetase
MNGACTRLAPSPTGALHLGNARTFLINWALARQAGWSIVLRIDDLDGPRIKAGADRQAIDLLQWLGLDWDEGPVYQSADLSRYQAALAALAGQGLTYPCRCTRSEISEAQSAPHGSGEVRYPGTCRPGPVAAEGDAPLCVRVLVPSGGVQFTDGFAGEQCIDVQQTVGDFIVATKAGAPAYQLAVVVDDALQGITHVVRGDDLLTSTPRQMLLYGMLDLHPRPNYIHIPLVIGSDGLRLAKRHGDTRLAMYRQQGVRPQRVIGLLAEWCGLGRRCEMDAQQFARRFELSKLSSGPAIFTAEDDAWLRKRGGP